MAFTKLKSLTGYSQQANHPRQSDDVTFLIALSTALGSNVITLTFHERRQLFAFDHILSIGFRSGLYGGR